MNTPTISVVIPFLNEEQNLLLLHEALTGALDNVEAKFEWLFVDDGSTDGGPAWLERKRAEDPRIRLIRFSRNFGHQAAITAGLDRSRGDAIVIIDADLQDPPDVIPDMIARWREGYRVVYGRRTSREGEGFFKKLFAASFYRIFKTLTSFEVPVDSGDFRLLDRKVVDALKDMRECHRYMRAMTSWVGFRQTYVTYERQARQAGETKYPVWKSLRLALDGLTSFTGAPLRWVSGLGLAACLFALLWFVQILWTKVIDPSSQVRGWASIVAAILFMGGVQLVSLGLIGQYMSRTFEETKKRPLYIIDNDTAEND